MKKNIFIIAILPLFGFFSTVQSRTLEEVRILVDELVAMSPSQLKQKVESLPRSDAEAVYALLSAAAQKQDGNSARIFLLEHISAMKASELEQQRVNHLAVVFTFTILLVLGFFIFTLISQRKLIRRLEEIQETADRADKTSGNTEEIFRG